MQVVLIAHVGWMLAAAPDAGVVDQRSSVQLEVAEYRPMPKREPSAEDIRTALLEVLSEQKIPVSPAAKIRLRVELVEAETDDEKGAKTCARVRSWIVDTEKEYLPKREMITERCVATSQPRIASAGSVNWVGVADAISRVSHQVADALTDAYGQALGEVIGTLRRRLGR